VIDEYHEIEDSQLFIKLKFLESDFRWIISGTPFKEKSIEQHMELDSTSLSSVIDYLSYGTNNINKVDIYKLNNYNYVKNHFSRNTHKKNMQILKLPEIVEETVWLNFTQTERMIYNAYLADPNNTVNDVFLRQICCHPMISDKIRENISNKVESLEDIKIQIKKMYMGEYEKAEENYKICIDRIERIQGEMKEMEKELKTGQKGYQDLKEDLEMAKFKSIELKKIRDGKEKTVVYYKTFIDLISDMENVKKENCTICLDPIKEEDLGITFCGHIYCYSCISTIVKESKSSGLQSCCPACKKELNIKPDNLKFDSLGNGSVQISIKNPVYYLGTLPKNELEITNIKKLADSKGLTGEYEALDVSLLKQWLNSNMGSTPILPGFKDFFESRNIKL
jgi:hypothetical protein